MTRPATLLLALLGVSAAAALAATWVPAAGKEEDGRGREVFLRKNCQYCHAVSAVGIARGSSPPKMRGSDLSDIGLRRTPEQLLAFLRKGSRSARQHWRPFWGTNRDLETLVSWLSSLRQPPVVEGSPAP